MRYGVGEQTLRHIPNTYFGFSRPSFPSKDEMKNIDVNTYVGHFKKDRFDGYGIFEWKLYG